MSYPHQCLQGQRQAGCAGLGFGSPALIPWATGLTPSQLPRIAYLQTSQSDPHFDFVSVSPGFSVASFASSSSSGSPLLTGSQGPTCRKRKLQVLKVVSVSPLGGGRGSWVAVAICDVRVLSPWVRGRSHGQMPCMCSPLPP